MFDIQPADMLNRSKQRNFVFTPVGNICNVQIFTEMTMETCAEMIGNLNQIIAQLPQQPVFDTSTKIESPYDISPDTFVFDVAIDSSGGDRVAYKAIASMFALAKSRGAIIRTNNIGRASSAASMLAIQGTLGYRLMSQNAYNFIHYGTARTTTVRANEVDIVQKNEKMDNTETVKVYKLYTKLTDKELKKFFAIEGTGQLFADTCLAKNLCDWILTSDGRFIGRNTGKSR